MPQRACNEVGLIDHAGADRAGIDLDQTHHVRILLLDEFGNARQDVSARAKVAGARHRKVESGPRTGGISYIVNQQSPQALYRRAGGVPSGCMTTPTTVKPA